MKVTNLSGTTLFLNDLIHVREAQNQGRRGEQQYIPANASVYFPNTSEVLRSAATGHLARWRDANVLELEDTDTVGAGLSVVLTHNFGYPPAVYVLKRVVVGPVVTWVDATGAFDAVHSSDFNTTTITNTTGVELTFMTRLL